MLRKNACRWLAAISCGTALICCASAQETSSDPVVPGKAAPTAADNATSAPAADSAATPESRAAATPAATPPGSGNPIVAGPGTDRPNPASAPRAPRRSRVISADVAAQLSAAAPKFTPPPPPKPAAAAEEEQEDLREIDKPKNGIIRLPKYVVREPAPPVLNERAVNTKAGLADIAKKRYLSDAYNALNGFTLPLFGTSPESRAMSMYEEDERLRNMASLSEDARLVGATDKEAGQYVKRQAQQTYSRPGDFDWKPLGR
jgi:hypothetical protein